MNEKETCLLLTRYLHYWPFIDKAKHLRRFQSSITPPRETQIPAAPLLGHIWHFTKRTIQYINSLIFLSTNFWMHCTQFSLTKYMATTSKFRGQ
jgi:hypothetical protein